MSPAQPASSQNGGAAVAVPPFRVYLFDVDGTLVDSAPDICGAVLGVLDKCPPKTAVDEQHLKRYIGHHLTTLFADLFPDAQNGEIDEMIAEYRRIYPLRNHAATRVYPGVVETLARLPGLKSTATTKATATVRTVLELFDLLPFFDHVQGTDGFPAKPAPDVILKSVEHFGVRPEECLFVGDAAPDMEAGRRAGVRTCAVRYGYGDPAEMERWQPDYWIASLPQLMP